MTNRLSVLRSQLAGLRRARGSARAISAWSAAAIAVLLALAAVLVFDLLFQLGIRERAVVLALAVAAIGWAFWRYAIPLHSLLIHPVQNFHPYSAE